MSKVIDNIEDINAIDSKANIASPALTGTPTVNGVALVKLSSDGLRIEKSNGASIKNQCTAWVNFDGTTTPPTIRDSYNVSSVVRTSAGNYEIYFTIPMDNTNYSTACNFVRTLTWVNTGSDMDYRYTSHCTFGTIENGGSRSSHRNDVQVFGGKN